MGSHRRKSISSDSSSSSSSDSDSSRYGLKVKKDKKKDKKGTEHISQGLGIPQVPGMPQMPLIPQFPAPEHQIAMPAHDRALSPNPSPRNGAPFSGFRIPLTSNAPLPAANQMGTPPCIDADGHSPVYFGSAIFPTSVHPCKVGSHLQGHCAVPYGGGEHSHNGRYDLLPFDPNTMELVHTTGGRIPDGRFPVEGGYEENGAKLYHAIGVVNGIRVPGKTGAHLGGCNVAFGGGEHILREYEILCWR